MRLQVKLTRGKNLITNNDFDSGYDLMVKGYSRVENKNVKPEVWLEDNETFMVYPNETILLKTGVHLGMPEPIEIYKDVYKIIEFQIRGRSGMSLKFGTNVKLGTGDNIFLGDCGIIFHNESTEPQVFKKDDRLGQLVFNEVIKFMDGAIDYVDDIVKNSDRGNSGFGDSGISGK